MQEQQQQQGTAQVQDTSSAAPTTIGNIMASIKPNRRFRRAKETIDRRAHKAAQRASERRLKHFKALQEWQSTDHGCSSEQRDSVFRVALSKLFKNDFAQPGSFERQLSAIVRNVKAGFKYKADVAPAESPSSEQPSPSEG